MLACTKLALISAILLKRIFEVSFNVSERPVVSLQRPHNGLSYKPLVSNMISGRRLRPDFCDQSYIQLELIAFPSSGGMWYYCAPAFPAHLVTDEPALGQQFDL